ncbi:hypothetical protein ABTK84_20115, partial [Acinetobacter baumannii]
TFGTMTACSRRLRQTRRVAASALLGASVPLLGGATIHAPSSVTVEIEGLRSTRGLIQACLTADPATFPDCQKDPQALHVT